MRRKHWPWRGSGFPAGLRKGASIDRGRPTGLGDGQVVALVSQVIVTADQTQATLLNRIVAYVFAGDTNQAAAIEHRASGIAILQAADLVGQARVAADGTRTRDPRRDRPVF